jgi:uncharacterized protein (DUF169 family)
MTDYRRLEERLAAEIGLVRRPVAIAFLDAPPAGVAKFEGAEPSSCSFWRLAAEGRTFYTVPSDHWNCPIGSYTHTAPLPPQRAAGLEQTLGLMGELGYVRMEEIPGVFRLPETPKVVLYAPRADIPVEPSVVLFVGRPARVMLLVEAAMRAGILSPLPRLARPSCVALPAALQHGLVTSAGCIGNRVYTGIGDDELYVAAPGRDLERLAAEVEAITAVNAALADYHRLRQQAIAS